MNKKTKIILLSTFFILVIFSIVGIYFAVVVKDPRFVANPRKTPSSIPTFSPEDKPEAVKQTNFSKIKTGDNRESIIKLLGQPKEVEEVGNSTVLNYETEYLAFPNKVILIDDQFAVTKEVITTKDERFNKKIEDWIKTSINSSVSTFIEPTFGDAYLVNIYPQAGFALLYHADESVVFEVWNFTPASIEEIRATWGSDLLTQEEYTEKQLEEGHY